MKKSRSHGKSITKRGMPIIYADQDVGDVFQFGHQITRAVNAQIAVKNCQGQAFLFKATFRNREAAFFYKKFVLD